MIHSSSRISRQELSKIAPYGVFTRLTRTELRNCNTSSDGIRRSVGLYISNESGLNLPKFHILNLVLPPNLFVLQPPLPTLPSNYLYILTIMKLSLATISILFAGPALGVDQYGRCDADDKVCRLQNANVRCNPIYRCTVTNKKCFWIEGNETAKCDKVA